MREENQTVEHPAEVSPPSPLAPSLSNSFDPAPGEAAPGLLRALLHTLAGRFPNSPLQTLQTQLGLTRPEWETGLPNETPVSGEAWEKAWLEAETLCSQGGGSPALLPQDVLRWLDGGSFLTPVSLLRELRPHVARLHQGPDPRLSLVETFAAVWNRLHPCLSMEAVHRKTTAHWTDVWIRVLPLHAESPLDVAWLLAPWLKNFPVAFSLPALEVVQAVADPRQPRRIVDPGAMQFTGGRLEMGGMLLAEPVGFGAFLSEIGMPPNSDDGNVPAVCLVHADYYCPRRRRVVLNAGCAYGAPWFLFKIGFRSLRLHPWNFLDKALSMLRESPSEKAEAAPSARPRRFVYHRADDSISCDGKHLTRGVPARILRRLVRDFVRLEQHDFEFREFKRDPDIILNPKHSNFEGRLKRVEKVLGDFPCGLSLAHPWPGHLRLEASDPVDFFEDD